MTRLAPAAWLALLLCACETAPVAPVPDPLPEALPWGSDEVTEGGAFLGLATRENDGGSLDELSFDPGIRVTAVAGGSPAALAGLELGDIVLAFDEQPLYAPEDLAVLLAEREGGAAVVLEVLRGDTVFEVQLTLRAAGGDADSTAVELYRIDVARTRAAWATAPGGVMLVSTAPDGPTVRAGLAVGDLVVAIDAERVTSDRGMIRRLLAHEPGAEVELERLRGDASERVSVNLFEPREKTTRFVFPILWNWNANVAGDYAEFALIDLYFISLFRYRRDGEEKEWRFLRFFQVKSGVGELSE